MLKKQIGVIQVQKLCIYNETQTSNKEQTSELGGGVTVNFKLH